MPVKSILGDHSHPTWTLARPAGEKDDTIFMAQILSEIFRRYELRPVTVVERILPVAASNYVQPLNYAAYSCSILLCANTYQLQISSADTVGSCATERSLATFLQASRGDYQISEATVNGYQVTIPSGSTHGSVTGLGVDNSSIQYLGKYFTSLFKGVATMDAAFGYGLNNSDPVSLAAAYGQQPSGSGFWNNIAYTLSSYGYTDQEDINTQFNAVFANIATSLGIWFRDFYTTQDDGAQGQHGLKVDFQAA